MSLTKWFKENWVDISRPKKGGGFEKCGRTKSGKKKTSRRKKAPKGYHYMPNGRLMKDSAHTKRKRKK